MYHLTSSHKKKEASIFLLTDISKPLKEDIWIGSFLQKLEWDPIPNFYERCSKFKVLPCLFSSHEALPQMVATIANQTPGSKK